MSLQIVTCPECGSSDVIDRQRWNLMRPGGPGEWYMYHCQDCTRLFLGLMPEPIDEYVGDGVFAENH